MISGGVLLSVGSGFTGKHQPWQEKAVFWVIKGLLGCRAFRRPEDSGQRKHSKSVGEKLGLKKIQRCLVWVVPNPQLGVGPQ